jgi:hypothetical protein
MYPNKFLSSKSMTEYLVPVSMERQIYIGTFYSNFLYRTAVKQTFVVLVPRQDTILIQMRMVQVRKVQSFPLFSTSTILKKSARSSKALCSFAVKYQLHRTIISSFYSSTVLTTIKRNMSVDPNLQAALYPKDLLWDPSWVKNIGEETIRRRSINTTITNTGTSNNNSSDNAIQFYSSWFCPFAQRTWIALEESGVNYEWNEVKYRICI